MDRNLLTFVPNSSIISTCIYSQEPSRTPNHFPHARTHGFSNSSWHVLVILRLRYYPVYNSLLTAAFVIIGFKRLGEQRRQRGLRVHGVGRECVNFEARETSNVRTGKGTHEDHEMRDKGRDSRIDYLRKSSTASIYRQCLLTQALSIRRGQ